jgi:hypothetical protein
MAWTPPPPMMYPYQCLLYTSLQNNGGGGGLRRVERDMGKEHGYLPILGQIFIFTLFSKRKWKEGVGIRLAEKILMVGPAPE